MMSFRMNWDKLIKNKIQMQICGTLLFYRNFPLGQNILINERLGVERQKPDRSR